MKTAVPAALNPLPEGTPDNRLGLAKWLVDPNNPLTARVAVNRFWQMYFGNGLVKTVEDFGSQGDWPTHPALLDWLATEFVMSGWNVKALQKQIVMSATYRQSSRDNPGDTPARSRKPAAGQRPTDETLCRDGSRSSVGNQWPVGGKGRRPVCQTRISPKDYGKISAGEKITSQTKERISIDGACTLFGREPLLHPP